MQKSVKMVFVFIVVLLVLGSLFMYYMAVNQSTFDFNRFKLVLVSLTGVLFLICIILALLMRKYYLLGIKKSSQSADKCLATDPVKENLKKEKIQEFFDFVNKYKAFLNVDAYIDQSEDTAWMSPEDKARAKAIIRYKESISGPDDFSISVDDNNNFILGVSKVEDDDD